MDNNLGSGFTYKQGEKTVNLNRHSSWIFLYSFVLATLLAVLAGFDGIVTVQTTPFGLKVVVDSHSTDCLIDSQLPNNNG
ncbi:MULTISPECIES: hypothetical protein [unclassified Nostoc]|uniref:hypothetical protein n=1 Tax=unclassified Nostoc TaxID=2593658 RepID=UPI002AD4ED5B|nr:hypothetical protein [Nostoc sp. ChiQUE02]MDZ8234608.1 hypothetical protein [Nostoc sp. ChiQUE02]